MQIIFISKIRINFIFPHQEFDATIMQPAGIVQRLERIEQRAANANAPPAAANGRGGSPAAAPVALD
jgi:hypothetical protein